MPHKYKGNIMDKNAQKLVNKLQSLIDGIKDESISVTSVSATIGEPVTIGYKKSTSATILTFEFHKKTTL